MGTRGHCQHELRYECGVVTRDRVRCLTAEMIRRVEEICRDLAPGFEVEIQSFSATASNMRIVFECEPVTQLTRFVNSIKTVTSRRLHKEFASKLPAGGLWDHSYVIRTVAKGKQTMDDYLG